MKNKKTLLKVGYLTMLTFFLLLFLVPVVLIIINSFKNEAEFYARGVLSLPLKPSLNIFREVWQLVEFDVKLFNSLLISSVVACLGLVLSVMNAYAIGIGKIRWDKMVLIFFAFAMVIPHEALAYPLYYLMKMVGLYDTKLAVILIFAVLQSAYGTYLLSSVFRTFPDSLLEAAGIRNIRTKSIGTSNPINCAKATMNGLINLKTHEKVAALRGLSVDDLS